jgi:nucleoside 2-deoxyribosyltransferase
MRFLPQKEKIAEYLSSLGHEVEYSNQDAHKMNQVKEWKLKLMKKHIKRIEWAEAVLIINLPAQRDVDYWVESYIGPNTLGEVFIAWYLGKDVFSWFKIPEDHPYFEELDVMNVKTWEPKNVCSHPNEKFRKISRNYVICEVCGNIKIIQ